MVSVEIICLAVDEIADGASIHCLFDGNKWIAQEPSNTSFLFKHKAGNYESLGDRCLLWTLQPRKLAEPANVAPLNEAQLSV